MVRGLDYGAPVHDTSGAAPHPFPYCRLPIACCLPFASIPHGSMTRVLITSALPYINGVKHLGTLTGSMLPHRGTVPPMPAAAAPAGCPSHARCCRTGSPSLLYVSGDPSPLEKSGASPVQVRY